ncbi:MAG: amidohydrolase [Bacteroidota bacterium]
MHRSFIFLLLLLFSCQQPSQVADMVIINAEVYTIDPNKPQAEAIAIKDGRLLKVGTRQEVNAFLGAESQVLDAQGAFVMPGFIEGHGHFSGLGFSQLNLNFLKAKNWDEIVQRVGEKAKEMAPGEWIEGRGWHQEKWDSSPGQTLYGYPFHDDLSAVSPDNPVILIHASGHSLFANAKAMEAAGISLETPDPEGGAIIRDNRGNAIGVFEERAMGPIRSAYQAYLDQLPQEAQTARWHKAIELAQQDCLQKGITSFQDAGSSYTEIDRYRDLAEKGQLDLRLWAMLRHSYKDMKDNMAGFPMVDIGHQFFTCKAIKTEVDGALGAFGAWLLRPYNDKPGFSGQNTTPVSEVESIAGLAFKHDMQLCVHAIGDRANRTVLNIIEKLFQEKPSEESRRWRIEHAQHLHPNDIPRFKQLGVIASMQGVHCTSDAPFVVDRLGEERARIGAYAWRSLIDAGAKIANGTDAPVEDVDPLPSLYASVSRTRSDDGQAFFPEQSMTREEALYSYTMGNAYAAFEENQKGSLTEGKVADIIVLDTDLIKCEAEKMLDTKVLYTIVDGEVKYKKNGQ